MAKQGSISQWLELAKAGDEQAIERLWDRYFPRLVHLARRRLNRSARRVADEEDIALGAFAAFCVAVRSGRYEELKDRKALWRLLATITANESNDHLKHLRRLKRGGGAVRGDSAFANRDEGSDVGGIDDVAGDDFPPDLQVQLIETIAAKLAQLTEEERIVAIKRMAGFPTKEIAAELGRAPRTIELRLSVIRKKWNAEENA